MKTSSTILAIAASLFAPVLPISAQTKWADPTRAAVPVIAGRGWQDSLAMPYARLLLRAEAQVRDAVRDLSRQSAGLSVAFRTNAPEIKVRYTVAGGHAMAHMPATGVTGVDLYATDANGRTRWCAARYAMGDTIRYTYSGLTYTADGGQGYEYRLYLPLYNTVKSLEIGVDTAATFRFVPVTREKPIVVYGTSIAQGACASRPGMAWANIVGRETGYPVVNLGFSGNGRLEPELFSLMAEIDARAYIIDCMPNLAGAKASVVAERAWAGVKALRRHSSAPILLVEHSGYTNEASSAQAEASARAANVELRKAYDSLRSEGVPEVYYLTKEEIGLTQDAMVEGVHPSDLGMRQYADAYIRRLRSILREDGGPHVPFSPRRQQRDSYDWAERHEAVLRSNAEQAPDVVMIGNSITHYWGGEPKAHAARGEKAWRELFRGQEVRNMGFGWDRIENGLWRIYHGELDGYSADKVFLLLGTNNLSTDTDRDIITGIGQLLRAVRERQPRAKVYVCGIMPRQGMEPRIAALNRELRTSLPKGEATYVDLTSLLVDESGCILPGLFLDGLHPNEAGYERVARMLKPFVRE